MQEGAVIRMSSGQTAKKHEYGKKPAEGVQRGFLPVCREDLEAQGIERLDFVYVIGDAYVDHPSFGHAVISRVLWSRGYTVGIISQPDPKDADSITVLGEPRLGFLVSSGNMDSMVNHYYVSKKHRETDAYTPGGKPYMRPDHATVVYSNLIRKIEEIRKGNGDSETDDLLEEIRKLLDGLD